MKLVAPSFSIRSCASRDVSVEHSHCPPHYLPLTPSLSSVHTRFCTRKLLFTSLHHSHFSVQMYKQQSSSPSSGSLLSLSTFNDSEYLIVQYSLDRGFNPCNLLRGRVCTIPFDSVSLLTPELTSTLTYFLAASTSKWESALPSIP